MIRRLLLPKTFIQVLSFCLVAPVLIYALVLHVQTVDPSPANESRFLQSYSPKDAVDIFDARHGAS